MKGTKRNLVVEPNPFLVNIQKSLKQYYQEILQDKEEFWFVKSRLAWFVEGDPNTKFFYLTTFLRGKSNKTHGLIDDFGTLISNPKDIILHVKNFYSYLYSSHLSKLLDEANIN